MMIASGLFGLDPSAILNYGISGLGFLLAFLSFRLLSKEQSKRTPNSTIIRAIYVFQVFSVILILAGSFVEWYRAAHSVDTQLETTKAQLAGLKIDYENALKSALTDRSDLEEKFVKSRRESKDLETKLRTELNTANETIKKQVQELAKAQDNLREARSEIANASHSLQQFIAITEVEGFPLSPARIFVVVNGTTYSFPTNTIWATIQSGVPLPRVEYPVSGSPSYLDLSFYAIVHDGSEIIRLESSEVDHYDSFFQGQGTFTLHPLQNGETIPRGLGMQALVRYQVSRR